LITSGKYSFVYDWADEDGISKTHIVEDLYFDGTNRVFWSESHRIYSRSSGWSIGGTSSYTTNVLGIDYQFELRDGQYRYRSFPHTESSYNSTTSWKEWQTYEYNGSSLRLYNFQPLSRKSSENPLVLTK
jgi:hypothetical protein